jgi:hypothetical protein
MIRTAFFVTATLTVLSPTGAFAQQGPRDAAATSLVRQALQDYQDLEIDRAVTRLNTALRTCANNGCSPSVLARVHMSFGIVYVGGQQNTQEGVAAMVRALQADARTEPDTLLATPEINAAFSEARRQVGGARTNAPPSSSGSVSSTPTPRGTPAGSRSVDLLHTPATEQLENVPLPIYVEPASPINAARVYVHFRGTGMRQFQRQEMQRIGSGWGVELPCGQVIQGSIDYYITAVDDVGTTLATSGSEDAPMHVPILSATARRTVPAPALPGRPAPTACSAMDDCPPGMSGPTCRARGASPRATGSGGLGDPCGSNAECGEGLYCDAGACAVGSGSGSGDEPPPVERATRAFARFAFDLGGGVGFAFLSGQMSYAQQFINMETRQPVCVNYTCYRNIDPGFAPTYWLNANLRYNVTSRVGLALGVRFQFDAADWTIAAPNSRSTAKSNPMANLLVYGRLYYAFTPNGFAPTGLVGSAFVGGGGGQIEPKPGVPPSARYPSAHVVSGFGNAHVGGRVEYGLRNGFHVAGELTLHFMFPTFLFNTDVAALVGFHF